VIFAALWLSIFMLVMKGVVSFELYVSFSTFIG
jgi:hypothetical protein